MTLKKYLIGMFLSTVFCWISFGLILFYIDPVRTGILGVICFYLSLFFAIVGTLTLIGFYLRIWLSKNEVLFAHVGPSFRQAVLISIALIGCLVLQSFRLLNWWDGGLFVGSVALIEFYFLSR